MTKKNRQKTRGTIQNQKSAVQVVTAPIKKTTSSAQVSTVAPLLLTLADLCALLNVSRSTVYRLDASGDLPGKVKLGGQVRYHKEVIEKWLLEKVSQSTSPQGNEQSE